MSRTAADWTVANVFFVAMGVVFIAMALVRGLKTRPALSRGPWRAGTLGDRIFFFTMGILFFLMGLLGALGVLGSR